MTEAGAMSLAYLAAHPAEAAAVMDGFDPDELAAFVATVPARLAAPALDAVAPWRAGRCLAALDPGGAAAIVQEMAADRAATCLRATAETRRRAILDQLPGGRARGLRRRLSYPAALVGALMGGDPVSLAPTATTADAQAALRSADAGDPVQLYLVDSEQRPLGVVPLAAVLRARPERSLAELARGDCRPISAGTPIAHLGIDADWQAWLERPVVDGGGRLVGTIALARLLSAHRRPPATAVAGPGPALVLVRAALASTGGLLRETAALLAGQGTDRDAR